MMDEEKRATERREAIGAALGAASRKLAEGREEALKLLSIAAGHIGTAQVAVEVGHIGRLSEELVRAIGTLRQVSGGTGADEVMDSFSGIDLDKIRCSGCDRSFFETPRGPRSVRLTLPFMFKIATRSRTLPIPDANGQILEVRDYASACSSACVDRVKETWPEHPKRAEMLAGSADYPTRGGVLWHDEILGVQGTNVRWMLEQLEGLAALRPAAPSEPPR